MSLRTFLDSYEATNTSDIMRISEVDPLFEPTAYYLILKEENPLILFENVKSYSGFRMVTNLVGSDRRLAFAIGAEQGDDVERRWRSIATSSASPALTDEAPVKELVQKEGQVDLLGLPVPVHYEQDGTRRGFQRYITGGIVASRDPDRPRTVNLSFTRIQVIGKDRYAFDCGSKGHLYTYVQKSLRRGTPLPLTVVIGAHPLLYLLAASFMEDEYEKAASALPLRLTQGIMNDIPVPADAEIVIEAELLPEQFDEGPFSEYTGYVGADSTRNVARVKAIMRRKDAIYYDVQPSNSNEHVMLFSFPRHASVSQVVRSVMPPGPSYKLLWPSSASNYMVLGYVDRPEPGLAKHLGLLLLSSDPLFSKFALVNEGETKLSLLNLLANLGSSYSPERIQVIKGLYTIPSNPTASDGVSAKVVMLSSGNASFTVEKTESKLSLKRDGSVLVSVSKESVEDAVVSVRFPRDVPDISEDTLSWVMATRVRPDEDIKVERHRLFIDASREVGEIPKLPSEVLRRTQQLLKRTA
ncbi:MAG: UbiD family decarboxylase domain-containing protein [Thermoprotei archaeon]